MTTLLKNYVADAWVAGGGPRTPLRSAVTGEVVAEMGAAPGVSRDARPCAPRRRPGAAGHDVPRPAPGWCGRWPRR